METKYYDGTKLLSMKDINGEIPELYLCTTNRTGGKTTFFGRMLVNNFLKKNKKFILLYRYNYELDDVAEKFFKDIKELFFPRYIMQAQKRAKGVYCDLFLQDNTDEEENWIHCGYALTLNGADQIKKYSHVFNDAECILFDEFQSETNHYCAQELRKFLSIHTSVARGQGKQVRYVPVYMLSNQVSLLNPYYSELGISSRLSKETKFLKGDGFVLENGFIESASVAQKESAINRAFKTNEYVTYAAENVYLNDNSAFVEIPKNAISKYLMTIRYNKHDYAIREYDDLGIVYCDDTADVSYPLRISVTLDDHQINYVMLKRNEPFIIILREFFERGCFRFKNLKCKEALLTAISYY